MLHLPTNNCTHARSFLSRLLNDWCSGDTKAEQISGRVSLSKNIITGADSGFSDGGSVTSQRLGLATPPDIN